MTEHALFYAYRNAVGYAAECSCGQVIESQVGTEDAVAEAVRIHNESTVHRQWREWQDAVDALKRPPRRACPCHGTPQ